MNQAEYSQHRGMTRQQINMMIRNGAIPVIVNPDGTRTIDSEAADRAFEQATALRMRNPAQPYENPNGLVKARTATEVYTARLRQLEYEEKIGHLVRVEDLTRSMEHCAEMIVRDLDRIAMRAEDLAAAFTAGGIPALRSALKAVARDIRRTLADNMRVAADSAAPAEAPAEAE